jgi:protein O-GlcNAc transferase
MKILSREPKAKLWLLNFSKAASKYLRKEARAAGVDPARLIFHDKFPKGTELLAKGHADLFLDTPLFNAHTTGGDVLWAGIPVVTMPGENFAQRVASGLVHSAGLSNVVIARTLGDYTRLALALCRQTAQRRQWKTALQAGRETAPLFDTKLLTRHVETTMKMMWEVYAASLKPRHIIHRHVIHASVRE